MKVEPYLYFNGRCEEAANFYKAALGAEIVALMRWKESPAPADMAPPGAGEKIMHMLLKIGDNQFMASDGDMKGPGGFQGFAMTVAAETEAEGDDKFNKLVEGGQATMPMDKTFFAKRFGMLTDKFGVPWMVVVNA
jgi:PhnB protein